MKYGIKHYRNYAIRNGLYKIEKHSYPGGFLPKMTHYEALLILGLEDYKRVEPDDIHRAFIKKISINHPDRSKLISGF